MKHSPGPWEANEAAVYAANKVCTLAKPDGFYRSPAETEANARLIAAAPEMLDALKAVIADESNTAYPLGIKPWLVIDTILKVEAAIRKAEGK